MAVKETEHQRLQRPNGAGQELLTAGVLGSFAGMVL